MPTIEDYREMLTRPREPKRDIIIRGGKTEQNFVVPFNSEIIDFLVITYIQSGKILLRKLFDDVTVVPENSEDPDCTTSMIQYHLNEAESFRFKAGQDVLVQIKLNLYDPSISITDNDPATSKIFKLKVIESLDTAMVSTTFMNDYAIEVYSYENKMQAQDFLNLASGSNRYICKFLLDSNWIYTDNIAIFKDEYNHRIEVPIENNVCIIPVEVIAKPGRLYIGVRGVIDSETEITSQWSNSVRIPAGCGE